MSEKRFKVGDWVRCVPSTEMGFDGYKKIVEISRDNGTTSYTVYTGLKWKKLDYSSHELLPSFRTRLKKIKAIYS